MFDYVTIYDYEGNNLHREKVDSRFLESTIDALVALSRAGVTCCAKLDSGHFVDGFGGLVPSVKWFRGNGFKGRLRTRLSDVRGGPHTVYLAEHNANKMFWLGNGDFSAGILAALARYPEKQTVHPKRALAGRCTKTIYLNAELSEKAAEIGGGDIKEGIREAMRGVIVAYG